MKRFLAITLILSFALTLFPLGAFAEEYTGTCGEAVTWSLDSATGILTISGSGDMTDYNGDWELFAPWNNYNSTITGVIIEEGVTSIGNDAFSWCTSLMTAQIPESVTSIGKKAFNCCFALIDLYIPSSVESVGDMAFSGCKALETITVNEANSVFKSAGNCLIEKESGVLLCGSKLSIIPNDGSITAIAPRAFSDRAGLSGNVIIPEGVTSIGEQAFSGCEGITAITIPESIETIGSSAFYYCSKITEIVIPDSITVIPNSLLASCRLLEKVTFSDKITEIGISAFSDCASLTEIDIPETVQSIGRSAFYNCNLTSIAIPEGVTSIDNSTFRYCSKLEEVSLPESLTSIGSDAFSDCSSLNGIVLPENLTVIDDYAFRNCKKLESITVPEGVTSINDGVFIGCTSLAEVVIPEGVTSIGSSAFSKCALTEITVPESVTSIGANAFSDCTNLDTVIYAGTEEDWEEIAIDDTNTILNNAYTDTKCEHIWGEETEIDGTCVSVGKIITVCEICTAAHYEFTELNPDNHVWDEGTVIDEPTCTEKGSSAHVCEGCGAETAKEIDELGHDDGEWVFNDDGTKDRACTVCGEVLETLGADEHIPNDANGDGKVNMMDYILVKSVCLKGTDDESIFNHCDMTGDGRVNMFDYLAVKSAYFDK